MSVTFQNTCDLLTSHIKDGQTCEETFFRLAIEHYGNTDTIGKNIKLVPSEVHKYSFDKTNITSSVETQVELSKLIELKYKHVSTKPRTMSNEHWKTTPLILIQFDFDKIWRLIDGSHRLSWHEEVCTPHTDLIPVHRHIIKADDTQISLLNELRKHNHTSTAPSISYP